MQTDCGQAALLYSYLSFNPPQLDRRSLPPSCSDNRPPQSAFIPAERSVTSCSLSCHKLAALLGSWAWAEGRQRKQLLKYMPPNPSSSGASAQYTVVAAPCCCGRKEHRDKVEFSGKSKTHQLPTYRESIQTATARQRRHRKRQKWTDPMLSWEKKPKLYIYSIYIHIFIYLLLSLPSVYSYSYVGSHKCNRPTAAKGGK